MLDQDKVYELIGQIILDDLRQNGYVEITGVVSLCYRRGKDVEVWESPHLKQNLKNLEAKKERTNAERSD